MYSNSVRVQDVAWKTSRERWTIGMGGESGSERSVLAAGHDGDDLESSIFSGVSLAQSAGAVDCISAEGLDPTNECPRYNTKQSDCEDTVLMEFWEMRSTPSLPSLRDQLWPRVVAHDWVQSMGQIELSCVLMLKWIDWNRTVFDTEHVNLCWNRTVFDI